MIPPNIVEAAIDRDIDVLGITDHNSAENVAAVQAAAQGTGLTVIGGMEVTSVEEVHVLSLFDSENELLDFQQFIYRHLHGTNDPDAFGYQWVVDREGGVVDVNPRLLIGATTLTVSEVVDSIHRHGGLAIAAHVDRQSFSIVSQLGFIPADLAVDAIELSPFFGRNGFGDAELEAAGGSGLPRVRFSDAHHVDDVGRSTTRVVARDATVEDIVMALRGEQGRGIVEA